MREIVDIELLEMYTYVNVYTEESWYILTESGGYYGWVSLKRDNWPTIFRRYFLYFSTLCMAKFHISSCNDVILYIKNLCSKAKLYD